MDNNQDKNSKRKKYQKPEIVFAKKMEVISGVCGSGWGGLSNCRLQGVCLRGSQP